ncbi:MAG TPA: alginate lyase family protein [Salinimicrobium sp.]|nr:alginate lyase family protein [Salinimicrobium sp.]
MGWRYTRYRIGFALEKKLGLFRKKFPQNPSKQHFTSLDKWRKTNFFWGIKQEDNSTFIPSKLPDFESYKNGGLPFFSADILQLGENYDWISNPDSGYIYDGQQHWSKIQDYSKELGDIKFVWEKSRFAYLYDVIRHDFYTKEDHAEWVFDEISSWLSANPINSGPNYKCSQEISLRILNWTYALNYYKESSYLTEELFQEIMHAIYWQLKHVYAHIDFSRIAVRNNHALTETLTLYLGSIFYPFFPESSVWKRKGKQWFEQEVEYQIYPDGTFLQFSMNYHRVVVQLFSWAFKTAEFSGEKFNSIVYERAYKSIGFLYACQDEQTGWLPNYGSNDGALFFKFNSLDFRDYRPQLNALHVFLTGTNLYDDGEWDEDVFWLGAEQIAGISYPKLKHKKGWHAFATGGYYILREEDTVTFVRCGNHRDRPAQADNLHLDIWHKGKNILFDAGSYKYNTDEQTLKYFMGTESHNTVMLGDHDQMLKGNRFIWFNWSQAISAKTIETENEYFFSGSVSAFTYLNSKIEHKRSIKKIKGKAKWEIKDTISPKPENILMKQYWHALPFVKIKSNDKLNNSLVVKEAKGFRSDYYGKKEKAHQWVIESEANFINTSIEIE